MSHAYQLGRVHALRKLASFGPESYLHGGYPAFQGSQKALLAGGALGGVLGATSGALLGGPGNRLSSALNGGILGTLNGGWLGTMAKSLSHKSDLYQHNDAMHDLEDQFKRLPENDTAGRQALEAQAQGLQSARDEKFRRLF